MNGRQWISDNWRWIGPLLGALGSIMLAEIVFAETYGVPTVLAAAILAKYCQDPFTRSVSHQRIAPRIF
jgi:hypothetical protein